MSTIDEIMEAVESVKTAAAEHQRWPSAMRRIILGKETDGLRDLITAALADARREGAEAIREKAAQGWDGCMYDAPGETIDIGADIRALPLPTGSQPAGAVPGEWIEWAGGECPIADGVRHQVKLRDGYLSSDDLEAWSWVGWDHIDGESDIVAYRVLA